jgi:hypothetical protein
VTFVEGRRQRKKRGIVRNPATARRWQRRWMERARERRHRERLSSSSESGRAHVKR